MNVAGLFPVKKETGAAQTVHAASHSRPGPNLSFDVTDRSQPGRLKQASSAEQERVEHLRGPGNTRQPFQPPDNELEDQVSFACSTGARSATDGPFKTLPSASKRDP